MTALRLTVDQLTTLRGREVAKKAAAIAPKPGWMPRHKYRAIRTEADGINFASKAEAAYYEWLKVEQLSGRLVFFLRQTAIHYPGNKYVLDFLEFWANGDLRWVDVKGVRLPLFESKRKAVEAIYPFKITVARMTKNGPTFEASK